MNIKKVSVVMCTYNGAEHIVEQLNSILNQSYPIHELIIQDDKSGDGTLHIVRYFAAIYPVIKVFRNTYQEGYNLNFMSALFSAEGDVVALADQDDIWHKDKIKKQVSKLEEGFHLVFHNSLLFKDSPSNPIGKRYNEPPMISGLRLAVKPFIPGHACLFTAEVIPIMKKIYNWMDNVSFDSFIALTCFAVGKIGYIDEELVYWRRHDRATTYLESQRTYGRIDGVMKSLYALMQTRNRETVRRYFKTVSKLPFTDQPTRQVVNLLQRGTLHLVIACFVCGRHTSSFFTTTSFRNRIKAALAPLHLIRDGSFLVK